MKYNKNTLQRGDKSDAVVELQMRLSGFRGTIWDGDFGPGTELQVMTFQRDYMGKRNPSGIADQTVFDAIDKFGKEFALKWADLKCPCGECEGFGMGKNKGKYRSGNPRIERFYMYEYPGIHKAILWAVKAAMFYAKEEGMNIPHITSGYRCTVRNKQRNRSSTNHMGKAIDIDFKGKPGEDKRDDMDRSNFFRGIMVEKSNFQIGWAGRNIKALEPSNIAPTWIHADVRSYKRKYLDEKYFVTNKAELLSPEI